MYDMIKVEALVRKFTNGKKSLFTEKEQEDFSFNNEDLKIEMI
ncbi:hypothetical protein [Oceanobacillus sp. J11TS1]|nr:hypothetical protein [Oceanobacillus sp. J11TS1]